MAVHSGVVCTLYIAVWIVNVVCDFMWRIIAKLQWIASSLSVTATSAVTEMSEFSNHQGIDQVIGENVMKKYCHRKLFTFWVPPMFIRLLQAFCSLYKDFVVY